MHAVSQLDKWHGHPQGTWGADEVLAGRDPQRGTELCDIVETMYSLSWSARQIGDAPNLALLDRVETLAFNALAGTTTSDMWQHQYDHQTNGVAAAPGVDCGGSNGGMATVFGLQPNFRTWALLVSMCQLCPCLHCVRVSTVLQRAAP